jgi:hypothetical protein
MQIQTQEDFIIEYKNKTIVMLYNVVEWSGTTPEICDETLLDLYRTAVSGLVALLNSEPSRNA